MNSSKNKTFVLGDVHGNYEALRQVTERSGIDPARDVLITLGDICDGWEHVYECVELLLTFKNRIDLKGNHDDWFLTWLNTGVHPDNWKQGGQGTRNSFLRYVNNSPGLRKKVYLSTGDIPQSHRLFFEKQVLYYKDDQGRVFVHAGFNPIYTLKEQQQIDPSVFYWDRRLILNAIKYKAEGKELIFKEEIKELYIGHTQVRGLRSRTNNGIIAELSADYSPMHVQKIWNLDTGAGSRGKLTIMDIDSHQYWQSDYFERNY